VFHRLEEFKGNVINEVPVEPFETLSQRIIEEASKEKYDILLMSHVHFKSANVLDDLDELVLKVKDKVDKVIIDGGGAFGNVDIEKSLGSVMDHIYYMGGVLKFIGSGEGLTFMSLPKDCKDRPLYTGWLFGDNTDEAQYYTKPVYYADGAERYTNSTLEFSIWERTNAIMEDCNKNNFSVELKNKHTRALQDYLVKKIEDTKVSIVAKKNLVTKFGKWRALQTCYDLKDEPIKAKEVVEKLKEFKIYADFRGDNLRLCVAVYHTIFDIDYLVKCLKEIDEKAHSKDITIILSNLSV